MHKSEFKIIYFESRHDGDDGDESDGEANDDNDEFVGITMSSGSQDVCTASGSEEDIPMSEEPISDLGERFVI